MYVSMTYLHINFCMTVSSGILVITIKLWNILK